MMKTIFRVAAIVLVFTGAAGQAMAVTRADFKAAINETESGQRTGVINLVDKKGGILEVDGISYRYSPETIKVKVKGENAESNHPVHPGQKIEFRVLKQGDTPCIIDIQILEEPM